MIVSAIVTGSLSMPKNKLTVITINMMTMMVMLKMTIIVINKKTEGQDLTTRIKARAKYGLLR